MLTVKTVLILGAMFLASPAFSEKPEKADHQIEAASECPDCDKIKMQQSKITDEARYKEAKKAKELSAVAGEESGAKGDSQTIDENTKKPVSH